MTDTTDPRALVALLRADTKGRLAKMGLNTDAADALTAALDRIEALEAALVECRDEIDAYIQHEYPHDHPVQERYRQRDYAANPARVALATLKKGDTP